MTPAKTTRLSARDADQRVGGKWFRGYTNQVVLVEDDCTLDELVATDAQFVIYDRGLTVRGTVDLGSGVHSIIVVRGDLRARRILLGDAVLVVTGGAFATDFVFGGANEGVFELGKQIETPVLAMMDRRRRQMVLRADGARREVADLVTDGVQLQKLRKLLLAGRPIFRDAAARRDDDTAVLKLRSARRTARRRTRPGKRRGRER